MATDLVGIDPEDPQPEALERAAAAVRRGQVVAIPTDALYLLVADPFNLDGNRPGRNRSRGSPARSARTGRRRRAPRSGGGDSHGCAVPAGGRPLQPALRHWRVSGQGARTQPRPTDRK